MSVGASTTGREVATRGSRSASRGVEGGGVVRMLLARPHVLIPAVLTALLAFRAGGYFAGTTASVAVVLAIALAGRFTVASRPAAGWSPALTLAVGALVLLAAWTLGSVAWSDAPFRALSEFDRVLAYVLVMGLVGSFAAAPGDLDRLLGATALVIAAVALTALLSWLYPASFPTDPGKLPTRLAFPLTYWNAVAVLCGIGLTLVLHCSAGAGPRRAVRVLAAGAVPMIAVTIYFTLSRGGIGAAALGVLAYVVLAGPRRVLMTLLATAAPTIVALEVAYGAPGLVTANRVAAGDEADRVALVVVGCMLVAMALRAAGFRGDARLARMRVDARRRRRAYAGAAVVAALVAVATAPVSGWPGWVDDQRRLFVESAAIPDAGDQRSRLLNPSANGRIEHWGVAWDAFTDTPITGTGAGTFRLEWERERDTTFSVVDGHSLYIEVLGELGIPGLLLLLIALAVPLAVAARRIKGPDRAANAAFLAGSIALLAHAGVDWDWEMPVLFIWFWGAAAVVCARRVGAGGAWAPRRQTRVVAGLGCLLLVFAPATVAMSQGALDRAVAAFLRGDCRGAVDGALDAAEALRVRPEPFELLGYCDLRAGRTGLAVAAMESAQRRDPDDWQYAYGSAVARALDGRDPRPQAARALRLNPLDARAIELNQRLRRGGPGRWARVAAKARIPLQ